MRTAVKLRVAFEQATEETEETSAKVLASLGKIEEILRARGKEATTTKTDESVSIERLLMEAELCQMLDRKREELEEREREVAMEEERHREGVKAVLELKNKLKKEAVVAENNSGDARKREDDHDDMQLGDVVEEKDVLKAVSKKKEKSLDDFLNEEENNDDESASTAKTKYGEAARLKFEKQKKELLEKQRLAYEKAFRKR